jgi:hypothetical protein
MRLRRNTLLVLSCIFACSLTCASSAYASEQLNKVKAVFLFKFFDYVSWPDNKTETDTLCTYGHHPFGQDLHYIAKMRQAKKTEVIALSSLSEIDKCQILYIDNPRDQKELSKVDIKETLVVSSSRAAINYGGIISMEEQFGRVQLYINLKTARDKKLKISSRLLEISEVMR